MTAPNDDTVEHKVKNHRNGRENVRKKEFEEFESVEALVDLWEQHRPEKYENEAFCDERHVEENRVSGCSANWRFVETHNQEVDKREGEGPVRQKDLAGLGLDQYREIFLE